MYHQIDAPPPRGAPLRGLTVSEASFALQMKIIKLMGFQGLSMKDLVPYLRSEKNGKVVGITFDDGFQSILFNALPVLNKYGFTATCYCVSGMIAGTNSWDHELGIIEKPLMNQNEWLKWKKAGMEIGSHTRTHADLTTLDLPEAKDQIFNSKKELETMFETEVRHFCYPYGRYTTEHAELVASAGYATATTTNRGHSKRGDNLFCLKRLMIACATNPVLFSLKLFTSYEDRRK
jgi:peptidoglycan/xylan/chitin deacetylase (PgdA/CDA1 family)